MCSKIHVHKDSYLQVSDLKDKLREKEVELTSVFEACEAEKSAYEASRESADERMKSMQEDKLELESTVRDLTVMVEELREVRLCVLVILRAPVCDACSRESMAQKRAQFHN